MKLFFIAIVVSLAAAQGSLICCQAPGADACTEGIPQSLCEKAGGEVISQNLDGDCCCFARDAAAGDRCLPATPRAVCFGVSVQGTCQEEEADRCCCRPAGVVSDLDCIARIPVALCEKTTGAECVADATDTPTCECTIPGNAGTRLLPVETCTKFGGTCPADATTCCCIFEGQTDAFGNPLNPDPTDPGVLTRGECLTSSIAECQPSKKKRSGVCYTGPVEGAAADRCVCQDPAITGFVSAILDADGNPANLLRHVCETKLSSTCIDTNCCCKYPSAPDDRCIPNVQTPVCLAVGGAVCIPVNQVGASLGNAILPASGVNSHLIEWGPNAQCGVVSGDNDPRLLLRVSGTGTPLTGANDANGPNVFRDGATVANTLGLPVTDITIFFQELTGDEFIFTRFLGQTLTFEFSPAARASEFLLYGINLLGSPIQTNNPSEYGITVDPPQVVPSIFSGFIGGDNRLATITVDPNTAGRYRLQFSNLSPVHGILQFADPASDLTDIVSVVVDFPGLATNAPIESFSQSGFIPSFKQPVINLFGTPPAVSNLPNAGLNPQGPNPVVTLRGLDVTMADLDSVLITTITERTASYCLSDYANTGIFSLLPGPLTYTVTNDATILAAITAAGMQAPPITGPYTILYDFGTALAEDSLFIHVHRIGQVGGVTVTVYHDGDSAFIHSGFPGGTIMNLPGPTLPPPGIQQDLMRSFTLTTAAAGDSGTIQISGTPSKVESVYQGPGVLKKRGGPPPLFGGAIGFGQADGFPQTDAPTTAAPTAAP